jgi:integrase
VREALAEYAPSTVNLDVNVLVDTFNTAIREELIETNPAIHAERPKLPRNRWRILEPLEVARVANGIGDPVAHVMFLTLVLTGVRRFELYTLRWQDVGLLARELRVRDSKSEMASGRSRSHAGSWRRWRPTGSEPRTALTGTLRTRSR